MTDTLARAAADRIVALERTIEQLTNRCEQLERLAAQIDKLESERRGNDQLRMAFEFVKARMSVENAWASAGQLLEHSRSK